MELIRDQTFNAESVELDGKHFILCTFTDCILEYHGGDLVFDRTEMSRCRHVFFGRVRQTLHYLQNVGLMPFHAAEWGEFPNQVQ